MRSLGILIAAILIIAANAVFIHFAAPDSVIGRAVTWFLPSASEESFETPEALNRSFACAEPLPEFTLGPMSDPSDQEVTDLCACIWDNLPSDAKETATQLTSESGSRPSDANIDRFAVHFGEGLRGCGGDQL